MRQLTPCTACGRHHRDEAACPHCGAGTPDLGGPQLVRNLKLGALLAFTAATTAACYGTPPAYFPNGGTSYATPSAPASAVPTAVGRADMWITPKGGKATGDILQMDKVQLDGARLTIASLTVDFTATFELPSQDQLKSGAKIDLKDLTYLYAKARYLNGESPPSPLDYIATLPGASPVTGSLELTEVSPATLKGTLKITTATGDLALYFFCAR